MYCIKKIHSKAETYLVVQECESSFENSVNHLNIVEKLYASGEILVAYNTQMLGYCAVYANDYKGWEGYISLICVESRFQNQHIGQGLLKSAFNLLINKGMRRVRLEVNKSNHRAISFYLKNHFTFTGEETDSSRYMYCKLD